MADNIQGAMTKSVFLVLSFLEADEFCSSFHLLPSCLQQTAAGIIKWQIIHLGIKLVFTSLSLWFNRIISKCPKSSAKGLNQMFNT